MNHYIVYYELKNKDWIDHAEVEYMLASCGTAWKKGTLSTFIRLDSELSLEALRHKLNAALDITSGDTYYLSQIPVQINEDGTTRLRRVTNMNLFTQLAEREA